MHKKSPCWHSSVASGKRPFSLFTTHYTTINKHNAQRARAHFCPHTQTHKNLCICCWCWWCSLLYVRIAASHINYARCYIHIHVFVRTFSTPTYKAHPREHRAKVFLPVHASLCPVCACVTVQLTEKEEEEEKNAMHLHISCVCVCALYRNTKGVC